MTSDHPSSPRSAIPKPDAPFTDIESWDASDSWGFNCGPAALAAILKCKPECVRTHMGDFESKGYTNPTLMKDSLRRAGIEFSQTYRSDENKRFPLLKHPDWGLARVQWGGTWTRPNVPMRARYRMTHWIAMAGGWVFDINAISAGGWIPFFTWETKLAPWLIKELYEEKGADGSFWITHVLETLPKQS